MKLLLDQNLSRKIIKHLKRDYPGSSQVGLLDLSQASDIDIWDYAKEKGFAIVTLDADFHDYSTLRGGPPLIIWLRCGNRPCRGILEILLASQSAIEQANEDADTWCVEIY